MEIKDIKSLIEAVSNADIREFHLQQGDFLLDLNKEETGTAAAVQGEKQEQEKTVVEPRTIEKEEQPVAAEDGSYQFITSPIVGIYYSAASPDQDDFVKVGDVVKKGQVVCIVEAMKLMNEIESEYDGTVVEVLASNEQMVEYNQPLFRVQPA